RQETGPLSHTICAGCAPPEPQKPRSLRAYHAVVSPAVYTRSLDARSPSTTYAQGTREPAPCPWPQPGQGPSPQEWEKACAEPHARGVEPPPQTSPAPGAGHGTTDGNHEHTLKKKKSLKRGRPCTVHLRWGSAPYVAERGHPLGAG